MGILCSFSRPIFKLKILTNTPNKQKATGNNNKKIKQLTVNFTGSYENN